MYLSGLFTAIGGLTLFLYGMYLMGEGLSKLSGGRLEKFLEKMTDSPVKAMLCGAGVTAVIQSSSATTVMVVGLVNSGVMKLSQAAGIIMGANIGTTVTSWLLGLTEIDSSSIIVQLMKPASFSPVLGIFGVGLLFSSGRERQKNIASVLVGFSILMFGMETMSDGMRPLAALSEFTGLLTRFRHPLWGMLAGIVLTAIIQSSSASIGILQALCATGAVSYGAAIPIIMGQNIGTCATALLSSVGAGRNAKRAALVHLYFNVIGTGLFMIVFYGISAFSSPVFLNRAANGFGVAFVHSAFNIATTLVLLPFSDGLVKLACLTIPGEERNTAFYGSLLTHCYNKYNKIKGQSFLRREPHP